MQGISEVKGLHVECPVSALPVLQMGKLRHREGSAFPGVTQRVSGSKDLGPQSQEPHPHRLPCGRAPQSAFWKDFLWEGGTRWGGRLLGSS